CDRWYAVENIGQKPQNRIDPSRAILGKIHTSQHTNGNSNHARYAQQYQRSDNRVCHAAANGSDRRRQFREEVPVHGTDAVDEQVKKHQTQWQDHENSRHESECARQAALEFSPAVVVLSFESHSYCTARVSDVAVNVRSSS